MTIVAHRQRAARRRDARALPRRADRPGDRAAAAGAHAARRRGRPSAGRGSQGRRDDRATRSCRRCARLHTRRTTPTPRTHLLSNGRYAVMLTAAGSGYSRWRDLARHALARGRDRDDWGTYIFLRDVAERRGLVGRLPAERRRARQLRGRLHRGPRRVRPRATATLTTTLEVVVSPEDDAEVRRVSHHEHRQPVARDRAHLLRRARARAARRRRRASGLLEAVRADRVRCPKLGALLATRRRRSPGEPEIWAAHLAVVEGESVGAARSSRPTARASSGRGREHPRRRIAVIDGRPLSEHGRRRARSDLQPAPPRARSRRARRRGSRSGRWSRRLAQRACSTWPTSTTTRRPSSAPRRWPGRRRRCSCIISASTAEEAQSVPAPRQPRPLLRSDAAARRPTRSERGSRAPSGALWPHGISGDLPIVLLRIDDVEDLAHRPPAAARPRVLAHEAARRRPRDPERAGGLLRAGPAGRAGNAGARAASRGRTSDADGARGASSCCAPT